MNLSFIIVGVLLQTLPAHAQAATVCATIMPLLPQASTYVQASIERSEQALQAIDTLNAPGEGLGLGMGGWIDHTNDLLGKLADTKTISLDTGEALLQRTACLQVDVLLLQCQITKITMEIEKSLQSGPSNKIDMQTRLLGYMQERVKHLLAGALDPTYKDPTWHDRYKWDDIFEGMGEESPYAAKGGPIPAMCGDRMRGDTEDCDDGNTENNDGCSATCQTERCPFNTNYGPAHSSGYGCDETVLERLKDFAPASKELEAMKILVEQIDAYRNGAREALELQQSLQDIYGTPVTLPAPQPREHKVTQGCMVDANSTHAVVPLRSPFSIERDDKRLISMFGQLKAEQGYARQLPEWLLYASEVSSSDTSTAAARREEEMSIAGLLRNGGRSLTRSRGAILGGEEASQFIVGQDREWQVAAALAPMRTAISSLAKLGSKREGLRDVVIEFASFLRRSCLGGPCTAPLERILKIAFTDSCFPYSDGSFTEDTPENPRWKQCAMDACIQLPGVTLPASCTK